MAEDIELGEQIHAPQFKEGAATFYGELMGLGAVIKQGAAAPLRREREVLSRVDARGIPKVLDFHEDGPNARLAIERLPGESLDQIVGLDREWKSQPMEVAEAVGLVRALADHFITLSNAGLLYRDLTLSHVILDSNTPNSVVGLVDFEGSLDRDTTGTATIPEHAPGTWETMAPEEFTDGSPVNEATSTYNLGVVLLQLVSGKNPFYVNPELVPHTWERRSMTRLLHARGIDFLPHQEEPVGVVLAKSLHPDPEQRYGTVAAFKTALDELNTAT